MGLPYLLRSYPIFERAGMEEGRDPGVGGGGEEEFTALELPPPPPLPTGGDFQPAVAPGFKDEHPGGTSSDAGGRGYQEILPKTAYRLPERDTQVALRPGFGRNGRPVALYANHFAVKLLNSEDFYHYNASCLPSFFSFFLSLFSTFFTSDSLQPCHPRPVLLPLYVESTDFMIACSLLNFMYACYASLLFYLF